MIITLIAIVIAPLIILLFAWGFYFKADATQFHLASDMLRITFPYLLLISLTALSGSILNTYDNFSNSSIYPGITQHFINLSAIFLSKYLSTPIMALSMGCPNWRDCSA